MHCSSYAHSFSQYLKQVLRVCSHAELCFVCAQPYYGNLVVTFRPPHAEVLVFFIKAKACTAYKYFWCGREFAFGLQTSKGLFVLYVYHKMSFVVSSKALFKHLSKWWEKEKIYAFHGVTGTKEVS